MNATSDELKANVEADIHACEQLLKLMASERDALKDRDMDALQTIIDDKSHNLQLLEDHAKERTRWAALSNPHQPIENAWLDILKTNCPEMVPRWDSLKDTLIQCRAQNEVNGKLLSRNQQIFTRLLNAVRGQVEPSNLYTANGAKSAHGASHNIGEA